MKLALRPECGLEHEPENLRQDAIGVGQKICLALAGSAPQWGLVSPSLARVGRDGSQRLIIMLDYPVCMNTKLEGLSPFAKHPE